MSTHPTTTFAVCVDLADDQIVRAAQESNEVTAGTDRESTRIGVEPREAVSGLGVVCRNRTHERHRFRRALEQEDVLTEVEIGLARHEIVAEADENDPRTVGGHVSAERIAVGRCQWTGRNVAHEGDESARAFVEKDVIDHEVDLTGTRSKPELVNATYAPSALIRGL